MTTATVLVVAQDLDGTADLVVEALLERNAQVERIDTADFPDALSLAATPDRIDSPGWLSCVVVASTWNRYAACIDAVRPGSSSRRGCRHRSDDLPRWSRSTDWVACSLPNHGGGSTIRARWRMPLTSLDNSGWPRNAG